MEYRWFRVELDSNASPCLVLVRARKLTDALEAVSQRYPRRSIKEVADPGALWDVIDLRELPEPSDLGRPL